MYFFCLWKLKCQKYLGELKECESYTEENFQGPNTQCSSGRRLKLFRRSKLLTKDHGIQDIISRCKIIFLKKPTQNYLLKPSHFKEKYINVVDQEVRDMIINVTKKYYRWIASLEETYFWREKCAETISNYCKIIKCLRVSHTFQDGGVKHSLRLAIIRISNVQIRSKRCTLSCPFTVSIKKVCPVFVEWKYLQIFLLAFQTRSCLSNIHKSGRNE